MRIQKILVGVAMFVLLTTAAYAEYSVSSTPVTTSIATGRAELAGAVRLTVTNAATAIDIITIRYGYPITVPINAATGVQVTAASTLVCGITALDNPGGVVTVTCPAGVVGNYVEVTGVRVALDAQAISGSISVQVGTIINPIVAGQNSAVVINSVQPGLAAAANGATTPAATNSMVYLASALPVTAVGNWNLTEPFAGAWKTVGNAGVGATAAQGTQIRLTLSGLPAGVTVTIANNGVVTSATVAYAFSGVTFTSSTTQRTITFAAESQGVSEQIGFTSTVVIDPTVAALPLAVASYNITATLFPGGDALTGGLPPAGGLIPRFATQNLPSGGFTILTIAPNTTNFLVPYMSFDYSKPNVTLDTGLAIGNTTSDPFTVGGAVKQTGTITFNFYPSDGTAAITYTTKAGSPGFAAATTDGKLAAGQSFVALASQILAAAGYTKQTFTGYAIITLNATNGHGVFYVSDFSGFSAGQSMLVFNNPAVTARTITATEFLGN